MVEIYEDVQVMLPPEERTRAIEALPGAATIARDPKACWSLMEIIASMLREQARLDPTLEKDFRDWGWLKENEKC